MTKRRQRERQRERQRVIDLLPPMPGFRNHGPPGPEFESLDREARDRMVAQVSELERSMDEIRERIARDQQRLAELGDRLIEAGLRQGYFQARRWAALEIQYGRSFTYAEYRMLDTALHKQQSLFDEPEVVTPAQARRARKERLRQRLNAMDWRGRPRQEVAS